MSDSSPRYLIPFHPKQVSHRFADVLIIGAGIAGLRAAIGVDPSLSVLVVSKSDLPQSSSSFAQGGIASVTSPEDRFENHIADTLEAGRGLCDRETVEMVVREAPSRIQELIDWGTKFDLEAGNCSEHGAQGNNAPSTTPGSSRLSDDENAETGSASQTWNLALGQEGGHSHHRIIHALGDATGKEVMRAVIHHTQSLPHVKIAENTFTIDLITHEGNCLGALVWNQRKGTTLVWAKQTILCTGGCGQIFRETTNPPVATGDGHALAYRSGAELQDLEFMQFHPTVLYIAGSSRSLISEALRGYGAHLVDRTGYRFMPDYSEQAELAPRDVVSRAIVQQMEKTHHPNVYLSLVHLDAEAVRSRFPSIAATCAKFDIDIARDRIPVRPGAHYMIGGVSVDRDGRTTLPRLWAAGEVTSSGLHGANRLASNSLLEGLAFGAHVGQEASAEAMQQDDDYHIVPVANAERKRQTPSLDLQDIRNSLKALMWRKASVHREAEGLHEAEELIDQWCRYVLPEQFADPQGWELQNMLTLARLMIRAIKSREESRGVHQRVDFPETDDAHWLRHLSYRRTSDEE